MIVLKLFHPHKLSGPLQYKPYGVLRVIALNPSYPTLQHFGFNEFSLTLSKAAKRSKNWID
jgi:hypothetical protein